jgi:hypothetical protein
VRRLAYLIVLCVSVDFANPMLPGSVRFNADESIEGIHDGRSAAGGPAVRAPAILPRDRQGGPPLPARARLAPVPDRRRRRGRGPGRDARPPHAPALPAPSDDH